MGLNSENKLDHKMICLNCTEPDLSKLIRASFIECIEVPVNQSLRCTWLSHLVLSNGNKILLSSEMRPFGGWQEIGSIKLQLRARKEIDNGSWSQISLINGFKAVSTRKLMYCEEKKRSIVGLKLLDNHKSEITILTSPAPGALSYRIPGLNDVIDSEVKESDLIEVPF